MEKPELQVKNYSKTGITNYGKPELQETLELPEPFANQAFILI